MTLTAKDVAEITRLLETSSFDELHLEFEGVKLSLRRGVSSDGSLVAAPLGSVNTPAASQAHKATDPVQPPSKQRAKPAEEGVKVIEAPLLGTFYRAPKPGAPPFVEIGAVVTADTVVGIIEVMKLMNAVRSGVSGTVVEILASDGALVEYGESLVLVSESK